MKAILSCFTLTDSEDNEEFCRLEILGMGRGREFDQEQSMQEFIEKMQHNNNAR